MFIYKSQTADAKIRVFNLDGTEGQMTGNAIRLVAKYLYDKGIVHKLNMRIETGSGVKDLKLSTQDDKVHTVSVDMGAPELSPVKVPVKLGGERALNRRTTVAGGEYTINCVSMGNPHCVVFCDEVEGLNLKELGPKFEHDPIFPERVNAGFAKVVDEKTIRLRVWERGSGETLACGTGACAAVVAAVENGWCRKGQDVRVILPGGDLQICYDGQHVLLRGTTEKVFEGTVEV